MSRIVVTPPAGTITNTATATLNETDNPANNTATAGTLVDLADLSITKKAAQDRVAPGSAVTFSLLVKNKSAVPADVIVTDNLPADLTLTKCVATGNGVCGVGGNVTFSQLAAGASETVLLTFAVSASATEGTVISNTASVSSPVPDPDTSNNSSTASVTVAAVPILQKSNGLIAFDMNRGGRHALVVEECEPGEQQEQRYMQQDLAAETGQVDVRGDAQRDRTWREHLLIPRLGWRSVASR